jgi:hypothetical protein
MAYLLTAHINWKKYEENFVAQRTRIDHHICKAFFGDRARLAVTLIELDAMLESIKTGNASLKICCIKSCFHLYRKNPD